MFKKNVIWQKQPTPLTKQIMESFFCISHGFWMEDSVFTFHVNPKQSALSMQYNTLNIGHDPEK